MSTQVVFPARGRRRLVAAGGVLGMAVILAACSATANTPAPSALALDNATAGGALAGPVSRQAVSSGLAVAPASAAAADGMESEAVGSSAATGSAVAGTSIAYPCPYVGPVGVAPDHTIVVTGTGTVDLAADGSDRAVAERSALTAALADARAQADVIAGGAHVTIEGVLSVSASVSPYFAYPIGLAEPQTGATSPGAMPPTMISPPQGPTQLSASATVAYTIH